MSVNFPFSIAFLYVICMPTFHVFVGSSGVFIVNGVIILGLLSYLSLKLFFCNSVKFGLSRSAFFLYLLPLIFFLLLILISMSVGMVFGGVSIVQRDFYELYRPVLYILVFIFSYISFRDEDNYKHFEKLLIIVFCLLLMFGLNHFFRCFDFISELYTKSHNLSSRRVSVPFANPYDYAFFMSFFVFYFMFKTLLHRVVYFPLFFLAILLLLLTQSRSVAGGMLVSLIVIVPAIISFMGMRITNNEFLMHKGVVFMYVVLVILVLSIYYFFQLLLDNFSYLTGQFVRLLERGEIGNSGQIRINQFNFALNKASDHLLIMLFGNGPAKAEMEYVESIYNYLFYRYGLVGLLLYFSILGSSIIMCLKIVRALRLSSELSALFLAILVWLITIPILSIGNNFTEQVRTSFFYYSIIGILAAAYSTFAEKRGEK